MVGERSRRLGLVAGLAVLVLTVLPAGAATAKDGDVIRTGSCSGRSDWKLKLSPEDGRIEVEFEVDQNRVGRTWNVKLKRDGSVFWRGQRTTRAPSGSFEVRRVISDRAGRDTIIARAKNPNSGEVCRGSATF
jgi:hypothetical protein